MTSSNSHSKNWRNSHTELALLIIYTYQDAHSWLKTFIKDFSKKRKKKKIVKNETGSAKNSSFINHLSNLSLRKDTDIN